MKMRLRLWKKLENQESLLRNSLKLFQVFILLRRKFLKFEGKGKNGKALNEEENLEEDDGDETYITQTNLNQLV